MNDEETSIRNDFDALEICHTNQQQKHSYHERDDLLTVRTLPQKCQSIADTPQSPLLALPAELRNIIYAMVLADVPHIMGFLHRPIGEFSLRQPALAKVNRQLRHEILPMFYYQKGFGVRIYGKTHSEADQAWQSFLERFDALKTGIDGISYLSYIQRIEVELWHPAFGPSDPKPRRYNENDQFTLALSHGIYLQFGPSVTDDYKQRPRGLPVMVRHGRRVGDDNTDWVDRDLVRNLLQNTIARAHGSPSPHSADLGTRGSRSLQRFRATYPYERLVDLAMMIAAECKQLSGHVYLEAAFLHCCHHGRS